MTFFKKNIAYSLIFAAILTFVLCFNNDLKAQYYQQYDYNNLSYEQLYSLCYYGDGTACYYVQAIQQQYQTQNYGDNGQLTESQLEQMCYNGNGSACEELTRRYERTIQNAKRMQRYFDEKYDDFWLESFKGLGD